MESLIKNGVSLNFKHGVLNYTPLHYAARERQDKVAELLIKNGADIEARSIEGRTPLSIAVLNGNLKSIGYFTLFIDNAMFEICNFLNRT